MTSASFPRYIHQIWFQGCNRLNRKAYVDNVRKWRLLNPSWQYRCYDEATLRQLCYNYSERAGKTFDTFGSMHQKIDFGKYVLLYLYGGIYVDMDCFATRPLDDSKYVRHFIALSEEKGHMLGLSRVDISSWETFLWSGGAYTTFLNNGVILSSKNNPTLQTFIEHIVALIEKHPRSGLQQTTGPHALNQFFAEKLGIRHGIMTIPPVVFESCGLSGTCRPNEDTIALHKYEISWLSPWAQKAARFYITFRVPLWILFLVWLCRFFWQRIYR